MDPSRKSLSRRSLLKLGAAAGLALAAPVNVLAVEADEFTSAPCEYYSDLSPKDYDALLKEKAEEEISEYIQRAASENGFSAPRSTDYRYVYGSKVIRTTGVHDVANQPAGGVSFGSGGGTINVSLSGGGSVSVSVSLSGIGSVSVALPLTSRTLSYTGYSVNIPGDGKYYKATSNVSYYVQPYAVYDNGNGMLLNKGAVKEFYRIALNYRRV